MHVKKASVGIWNLVKCSALCVAFLTCIFTPISYTFCAETTSGLEIFEKQIDFPVSDYYLRVSPSDGSDSDVYYSPDSSGNIITTVPAIGSYITTAFFTSVTDLAADYGVFSVENFWIHIHFAVYEPYSDQEQVFDSLQDYYALVNGSRLSLYLESNTITNISDSEYIVDLVFRPNYNELAELLNGVYDTLEVRITWDPAYAYTTNSYYYSFVYEGSSAYLEYTKRDRDNQRVPISSEDQAILDGMNQKGEELEESGKEISDAVDQLESLTPDVGDPFENAPDYQVYATGSQFFIQLFDYLYANQMTGAFISFALIMALVVFIMRR